MKRWQELERYVVQRFKLDLNIPARTTIGSGRFGDADVRTKYFLIECKYRSTRSFRFSFSRNHWQKLVNESNHFNLYPLLITENYAGLKTIFISLSLLTELLPLINVVILPKTFISSFSLTRKAWDMQLKDHDAFSFQFNKQTLLSMMDFDEFIEHFQEEISNGHKQIFR